MEMTRGELRDHLLAVIEAAPELPPDNRQQLADVFLDELDRNYQLVPRGRGATTTSVRPARTAWDIGLLPIWKASGLAFLLLFLLVPVLFAAHIPFFVPVLVVLFVMRYARRGMRPHRRMWM